MKWGRGGELGKECLNGQRSGKSAGVGGKTEGANWRNRQEKRGDAFPHLTRVYPYAVGGIGRDNEGTPPDTSPARIPARPEELVGITKERPRASPARIPTLVTGGIGKGETKSRKE